MESYLIYIGKAALAAGTFYLLYMALFQHQKQFVFNRIYLPVSLAISFLIPLITFTTVNYVQPVQIPASNSFAYLPQATEMVQPEFVYQWYHYLTGIYLLGIVGFLFHLLLGHFRAINIIRFSRLKELFGTPINISQKDIHPFSFFNKIVLSEKTLDNPNLEIIVNHEKIHVDEKHTLDILFAEILFLFQWFNPFAWLIKDAMRNNLEYLTDHQIAQNNNAEAYQLAMVGLAHKKGVAPFLNALNGSQLKNRIIMMKKKTENKYALVKQLVVLPLLAVLVMGLSNKEVKTEFVEAEVKTEIANYENTKTINKQLNPIKDDEHVTIKGKVTDENGIAIAGATVFVAGKSIKTTTDSKGNYEINLEYEKETLFFTKNGFEPIKKNIDGDSNISVQLKASKSAQKELTTMVLYGDPALSQSKYKYKVQGKVTNEKRVPMAGVTIIIKDTKMGTITDKQGNYLIMSDSSIEALIVVKKGFVKQEVKIDGNSVVNIVLEADEKAKPEEIKVTGYETQIKPTTVDSHVEASKTIFLQSKKGEDHRLYIVDGEEIENLDNLQPSDIEKITVLKDESATALYGEKGKNGVILITTKEAAKKKLSKALVIVDGKKYEGDVSDINPDDIEKVDVLKDESATKLYGDEAKDGAIIITTKNKVDFKGKSPLIIIDGKKSDEDINAVKPEEIEAITVLKDASAVELYGANAKDGVILITTKRESITSELELRQFIAKTIKYPLRPQQDKQKGISKIYMKVSESGIINSISDEKVKDAIRINEVVVVGYSSGNKDENKNEILNDYSKYFNVETQHVLYQLPKLDIEEFLGKTLVITVKFTLQ